MKLKHKLFILIYFIIMAIIVFSSDVTMLVTKLEYVGCGTAEGIPKPIPQLTSIAYTLLIVGTPLILIIFAIVTLIKAISAGNADEIMKAKNKLFKKLIAAALIFVLASIVQFVITRVTSTDKDQESVMNCIQCFLYFSNESCYPSTSGNDVTEDTIKPTYDDKAQSTSGNRDDKTPSSSSSSNASDSQVVAIRKMFYAVETGGHEYGKAKYDDVSDAYSNTANETAITIGAGGWFANEGRDLLLRIQKEDPETFKKLDTAGIAEDLKGDWSNYVIRSGGEKGICISKILGSEVGIKVQDAYMDEQIKGYMSEAASLGISDIGGQVMYAEIRHCAGKGGATRILGHTEKPYTMDSIYKAVTSSWPEDSTLTAPINGSMFKSRHEHFYGWIKQYIK